MSNPRRALLFSFLDRYAGLLISILSSMVLARLLTPKEVGTFSVAMSLLAFAAVFRDLGAGQYLVQERELTEDRIRAVWAVQLGIGALLALLVAAAAYPAAGFFDEPALVPIFLVLALTYLVNPFGSITYAWLMREMRFDVLALVRFVAGLSGALMSIGLALWGVGALSLALGALFGLVMQAVVATAYRPRHFPWAPSVREWRRVLGFGWRVTGSSILSTLREYLPELIVARTQDLTAAGFFSRANGLVGMASRLVTDATFGVAQSLFAQRFRDGQPLDELLMRALTYMSVISWSVLGLLAVLAEPLIAVLYGSQWNSSVQLARWLALGIAAWAPVGVCIAMLMASGGTQLQLKLNVAHAALVIASALVGARFGSVGVCVGLAIANVLGSGLWIHRSCHHVRLPLLRLAGPLGKCLAVACLTLAPAAMLASSRHTGGWPPLVSVLACSGLALGAFLAALYLVRHPLKAEVTAAIDALMRKWARDVRP